MQDVVNIARVVEDSAGEFAVIRRALDRLFTGF